MTRSGLSLVIAALLLQAPATRAAQLDKDSCAMLKTEQAQLEQGGMRGNLGKGPEWAKTNLAPEKLEQIRRLIEVDEQLLFRCGGRPLVLLPSDPDSAAREVEGKDGAKGPPAKGTKTPAADKKPPAAEKKSPDVEKKKAVPLKKAAAPPVALPALETAKETPPSAPVLPQPPPEAAPAPPSVAPAPVAPAAALVPAAASTPPPAAPTPPAASAKELEDKKAAAIKAAKAKARMKADDAYRPPAADWGANPFAGLLSPPPAKK
jgi:hypothetical protein